MELSSNSLKLMTLSGLAGTIQHRVLVSLPLQKPMASSESLPTQLSYLRSQHHRVNVQMMHKRKNARQRLKLVLQLYMRMRAAVHENEKPDLVQTIN